MTPIYFKIEHAPVSVNKLYFQPRGSRTRILTPEGRLFKQNASLSVLLQLSLVTNLAYICYKPIKLELHYHGNWVNKNGSIKKKDIANYEKAVIDALFDAFKKDGIELDDSQIFEMRLVKVQSEQEFVEIFIYPLE
jgi:Holliday junction resolvase RusA-like endonuclease